MAGVSSDSGKGNSKLDVELNLVPFIDLLSTLVLFLLLTVVWAQVAAIPASVDSKGKSAVSVPQNTKLIVTLRSGRADLIWPASIAGKSFPKSVNNLEQLRPVLLDLVQKGTIIPASVGSDDSVEYGVVIQALDFLKEVGLINVALSTD